MTTATVALAPARSHTSARRLAFNTGWSLVGQIAPMVVAVFFTPVLVNRLGVERFGVLTLAWMVVGYFSLFDMGLGRALTKLVAEELGRGEAGGVPALVWTALAVMLVLGIVGAVVSACATPYLVAHVVKGPPSLRAETTIAFYLLAISLPAVIATTALRGLLEANQRFGAVNALRIPMGLMNFVGPALALLFTRSLVAVVGVLVVVRVLAVVAHHVVCVRALAAQLRPMTVRPSLVRPLIAFGGWMTVTNIVNPLMVYLDRFVIGALLSIGAVTFYVTPYEVVMRFLVIPAALVAVLFPAFSASAASDPRAAARLLRKSTRYVFLVMLPLSLTVITGARVGLELWLGHDFAENSTRVLQWLAAGIFVNAMSNLQFAYLHGVGRPDWTAKLHLVELPLYVASLWWAVPRFGILGAAVAWVLRATVDTGAILWMTSRVTEGGESFREAVTVVGASIAVLGVAAVLDGGLAGVTYEVLVLAALSVVAWNIVLGPEQREALRARLRAVAG